MIPTLDVLAPRQLPFSCLTYNMIAQPVGLVKGSGWKLGFNGVSGVGFDGDPVYIGGSPASEPHFRR